MARVKFIMLEADLPAGDIQQFTQAIQNALRPANIGQHRSVPAISVAQNARQTPDEQYEDAPDVSEVADEEVYPGEAISPKRIAPSKPRKYRSPKVLSDVDLKTEPSWSEFVAARNAEAILDKYLMVAAWFKEVRGIDAIGVDHVYTCFRFSGWSTGLEDFGQPLRRLRMDQLMESTSKGMFTINHLGLNRVEKLKGG